MVAIVLAALVASACWAASTSGERLADLLPPDLDVLQNPTIVQALGVQLLLFGGFEPTGSGWQRRPRAPQSLAERVDWIAPTWKPRGRLSYEWSGCPATDAGDGILCLFHAASTPPLTVPLAGPTTRSLARALEGLGLSAADFDEPARAALREMLTWQMPPATRQLRLSHSADLTLLVLSFDAVPFGV